jgi:hypothetical protein
MFRTTWTRPDAGARPGALQRLVAVPWRHPSLILACALAGAVATAALSRPHAAPPVELAHGHIQPILPAPDVVASAPVLAGAGGPGLRLALELGPDLAAAPGEVVARAADAGASMPGEIASRDDKVRVADASMSAPQPDDVTELDAFDALLAEAPTAAGRAVAREEAPAPRGGLVALGLLAGLLLGLLAAAMRELRGDRMRSVREAEWALGAPVLGAIPTLSARARGALLAPAARRVFAEPA